MYIPGGVGCGGCQPTPGGIGWFAQAMQVATLAASVYAKKSGGEETGACWTRYNNRPFSEPCPGTPNYDAVVRAVSRGPEADIAKIISYLLTTNAGNGPKNRAQLSRPECVPYWVKALMGGKGCVASTYPEAPGWFIEFVQMWGAPETPEEAEPGSSFLRGTPGQVGARGGALLVAGLSLFFLPKLLGR